MAQVMIVKRNVAVQTGNNNEFIIFLTNKKTARVYFSPCYKETVLSFNFGTSKSFIISKSMWHIFRRHIKEIDNCLNAK